MKLCTICIIVCTITTFAGLSSADDAANSWGLIYTLKTPSTPNAPSTIPIATLVQFDRLITSTASSKEALAVASTSIIGKGTNSADGTNSNNTIASVLYFKKPTALNAADFVINGITPTIGQLTQDNIVSFVKECSFFPNQNHVFLFNDEMSLLNTLVREKERTSNIPNDPAFWLNLAGAILSGVTQVIG